jgi:hypothetical protein
MDLRQYTVASPYQEPAQAQDPVAEPADSETRMVRLDLKEAEPDVQQMMDEGREDHEAMNARLSLLMWGIKVFTHEDETQFDPAQWRVRLEEARALQEDAYGEDDLEPGRGGTEHVASVCIRDHYDEMNEEERIWCVETVCEAIESQADNWNEMARVQRYSMGGDRPSAYVLSSLMAKSLPDELKSRVRSAFASGVLHPVDEVRQYAAAGVGWHLWSTEPATAIRCINTLATEATSIQEKRLAERDVPFFERSNRHAFEEGVATQLRENFYGDMNENAYSQLDIDKWEGAEANTRILTILNHAPTHELAIDAFKRLASTLVQWWDEDEERDRRGRDRREHSFDDQLAASTLLYEFVLKVSQEQGQQILEQILNAVHRHPKNTSDILEGIVAAEDRHKRTDQFWHLWQLFAERVKSAPWLAHLDEEHPSGGPMSAAIFMTQWWKDDILHWRSLEGNAFRVHELFRALPPSALVLDKYVRFLYHIGEQSLPEAFRYIAERLQAGEPLSMLRISNTVFMLEMLLRRYVYGRPLQLKSNRGLRESVLYLLDVLVESGSSSAYRMRDDFVTPVH